MNPRQVTWPHRVRDSISFYNICLFTFSDGGLLIVNCYLVVVLEFSRPLEHWVSQACVANNDNAFRLDQKAVNRIEKCHFVQHYCLLLDNYLVG